MDIVLCALDDLADPGSREFSWGGGEWPLEFFVVRQGESVSGFVNRCPHAGHPLNWQPDQFLTRQRDLILCNSHGARFRIDDGLCVLGPCPGAKLQAIQLDLRNAQVVASSEELQELLNNR